MICPHCGSEIVAKALYGLTEIDETLQEEIDSEKILLGGCVKLPSSFDYYCIKCQREIYLKEETK